MSHTNMGVSKNKGTPKSSILIGFLINKPPSILGVKIFPLFFGNIQIDPWIFENGSFCPGGYESVRDKISAMSVICVFSFVGVF